MSLTVTSDENEVRAREAVAFYGDGKLSQNEVAAKFNISLSTFRRFVARLYKCNV